jgi:CRP-like cAMP-binding protein
MHEHPVIASFQALQPLNDAAINDLEAILDEQHLNKNTELLKVGQVARRMYFIRKGLARVYYRMAEKDVTDYFAIDGQFIGAVPSLFTQQPSHKAIQLIEDSDVISFQAMDFEALCLHHHELERAARRMAGYAVLLGQQRIESLRFHSAAERYALLERTYPGITNRCPLQYIASYLNTTPESISRIRAGKQ